MATARRSLPVRRWQLYLAQKDTPIVAIEPAGNLVQL